mgnify:CR=1 FL=1
MMDPATKLCFGCGRTLPEIARWHRMDRAERLAVMGYDLDALLDELDDVVTSPRSVASDAVHGGYWALAQRRKRTAFKRMAPRVR